jgi:hypothetical protein
MAKDMKGSELQALLTEILGKGAVIQRTSGYIVRGITLKAQQATSHTATCQRLSLGAALRPGLYLAASG